MSEADAQDLAQQIAAILDARHREFYCPLDPVRRAEDHEWVLLRRYKERERVRFWQALTLHLAKWGGIGADGAAVRAVVARQNGACKMKRLALLLILLALLFPSAALAEAIAQAGDGKTLVILYSEPCTLTAQVTNLPKRAEWIEAGKRYEGCWQANSGIVLAFFSDLTAVAIPAQVFVKAQGV